jgi:hypothetical protein
VIHDDDEKPTGRDYLTVFLWFFIPSLLIGYVAFWKVGII